MGNGQGQRPHIVADVDAAIAFYTEMLGFRVDIHPAPGGWNGIQIEVDDLVATVRTLKYASCRFRTDIVHGNGGKQALLEDPSGNLIELFEPAAPRAS